MLKLCPVMVANLEFTQRKKQHTQAFQKVIKGTILFITIPSHMAFEKTNS